MYKKLTGNSSCELKGIYAEAINTLNIQGFAVHLKPTYYNEPCLSRQFSFTSIIPGYIPMQALDLLLTKGTIVTGGSETFLKENKVNLKAVSINELTLFLQTKTKQPNIKVKQ